MSGSRSSRSGPRVTFLVGGGVLRDTDARRARCHRGFCMFAVVLDQILPAANPNAHRPSRQQQSGRTEPAPRGRHRTRSGPARFRSSRSSPQALSLCARCRHGGDAAARAAIAFFVATLLGLGQTKWPLLTWPNALLVLIAVIWLVPIKLYRLP